MAAYAVLGATSWGLTLSSLLAGNGHDITVLVRSGREAEEIRERGGIARLPELRLGPEIEIVSIDTAMPRGEGLVLAVPAQTFGANLAALKGWRTIPVLSVAKGIERASGRRMSEIVTAAGWAPDSVSVLSGPNLAHEIVAGLPAAAVVASTNEEQAEGWQQALGGPAFRLYRSSDVIGVEFAGAMKNVIAIAAGAASGMGFGANTLAALVTRGLAETARLGGALGARQETFLGLAGVGDLVATCFSPLSRNRRFGEALARSLTADEAVALVGEVVEGAATAPMVAALASREGVAVPITDEVVAVLAGQRSVHAAVAALFAREPVAENAPG